MSPDDQLRLSSLSVPLCQIAAHLHPTPQASARPAKGLRFTAIVLTPNHRQLAQSTPNHLPNVRREFTTVAEIDRCHKCDRL